MSKDLRKYMGPRFAQIPRGAIVEVVKYGGKRHLVRFQGKDYVVPSRLLWKV